MPCEFFSFLIQATGGLQQKVFTWIYQTMILVLGNFDFSSAPGHITHPLPGSKQLSNCKDRENANTGTSTQHITSCGAK